MFKTKNTSWNKVAGWYQNLTKDGGHYFHRNVIIPNVLKLLDLKVGDNLLDLGCDNGVLDLKNFFINEISSF